MSLLAIFLVAIAVLLPVVLYFALAIVESRNVKTLRDFFPLTRFVPGDMYARSTAAAGVSLATVILVLVNLAPAFGLGLLVTIASYALSFVLLYFCASTILRANPENDTVQGWLGKAYGNIRVRNVALVFSFVGYVSIFSMELIVGVTVLEPFFGNGVLVLSAVYLVFLILYSVLAGFRALVATEQWQIRFVFIAVLSLILMMLLFWAQGENQGSFAEITRKVAASWSTPWAFALGIIAMNLPAPISDAGTWQRLCATSSLAEARRGLLKAVWMFVVLWGTLIIAGTYIAHIVVAAGQFDPAKQQLMAYIVARLASGDVLHLALLFIFTLGLFAAMITTADSLLLVAAQMYAIDYAQLPAQPISEEKKIRIARLTLASIALAAFAAFVIFKLINFDVLSLVFAIYGAQLALFPTVAAALFLNRYFDPRRAATGAIASVGGGFAGAWLSALYGKLSGDLNWLYNAPVVALVVSSMLFALLSVRAWRNA